MIFTVTVLLLTDDIIIDQVTLEDVEMCVSIVIQWY